MVTGFSGIVKSHLCIGIVILTGNIFAFDFYIFIFFSENAVRLESVAMYQLVAVTHIAGEHIVFEIFFSKQVYFGVAITCRCIGFYFSPRRVVIDLCSNRIASRSQTIDG